MITFSVFRMDKNHVKIYFWMDGETGGTLSTTILTLTNAQQIALRSALRHPPSVEIAVLPAAGDNP